MDKKSMIDDLINMLDSRINNGIGHINIDVDESLNTTKEVQTMGCSDCAKNPMACSVPTLHQGLDDNK